MAAIPKVTCAQCSLMDAQKPLLSRSCGSGSFAMTVSEFRCRDYNAICRGYLRYSFSPTGSLILRRFPADGPRLDVEFLAAIEVIVKFTHSDMVGVGVLAQKLMHVDNVARLTCRSLARIVSVEDFRGIGSLKSLFLGVEPT